MDDSTITVDADNPKYRQFTSGDRILEYTLQVGEITVDWVNGKDAASMMKAILAADGGGIIKISGYVTDKLGGVSNTVLQRFGNQMAASFSGEWTATVEKIEGRRYLLFTKVE